MSVEHAPLTKRQTEILGLIEHSIASNGYAPTLEEIGRAFGLTSLATIHRHLTNLEHRGRIRRRWGHARAIEVLSQSPCPTCGR